ncbi:MAG: DUF2807 domain-containing protein [Anaerolineae bacterium]|nr:DUF2807 domain-containing protein [Anaerolineae bacterium]
MNERIAEHRSAHYETREVSDFDRVVFSGFGELAIRQGEIESLTVEADDDIMPKIETRVSSGTLLIGYRHGGLLDILNWTTLVIGGRSIRFNLTVKKLTGLECSGAGSTVAAALATDHLHLRLSGAGNITFDQLMAEKLEVELTGAGSINVSGKVTEQKSRCSGVGSYRAGSLESQKAAVRLSGAGSATVWAKDELDAEISGVGSVEYYGSPRVSQGVHGVGSVKSLGNR